jgi:hypothetical protein
VRVTAPEGLRALAPGPFPTKPRWQRSSQAKGLCSCSRDTTSFLFTRKAAQDLELRFGDSIHFSCAMLPGKEKGPTRLCELPIPRPGSPGDSEMKVRGHTTRVPASAHGPEQVTRDYSCSRHDSLSDGSEMRAVVTNTINTDQAHEEAAPGRRVVYRWVHRSVSLTSSTMPLVTATNELPSGAKMSVAG